MHTNRFDQGWKELNYEEKIAAGISVSSAVLFAVTVIGFSYLVYDYQIERYRRVTTQCPDRGGHKLVSETIRPNGDVECRYVRDVTGLVLKK